MSDFELPTDEKLRVNPALEDFEVEPAIPPLPVESDFEMRAQEIIDRSPVPEQTKKILEQATAIHGVTKLSWDDAFNKAGILAMTKEPQAKKLGQAITDRWKAEQLSIRIGQKGQALMKAYQQADEVEIAQFTKDYDALAGQLPGYEDIAPAYPPGIWGAALGFGRRMLTGATGLVGQQVELIAGERQTERMGEAMESGKLSALAAFAFDETLQTIKGIGEVEAGAAFMDMVKMGVDPGIADRFAKPIGVINNILEFAELATFVKMFPGADEVISKATSGLLRKVLLGPVLKNTALRLTAKLATGVAQELAQEVAQEATTFYGENWAVAVNNATKGTALEGNKDFIDRAKAVVYDFLPGVLALGAIPIGFQAIKKGEGAKATAKPMVAPTPMETVRADVAKAVETETPNVEAARATLNVAETAKAMEIAQAEVLTPQMVNEAVELAGMQETVEEKTLFHPEESLDTLEDMKQDLSETKVVDQEGKPLVVYHGTRSYGFTQFNTDDGVFFTANKGMAEGYTEERRSQEVRKGRKQKAVKGIYAAYLNIRKPLDFSHYSAEEKIFDGTAGYLGNQERTAGKIAVLLGEVSPEKALQALEKIGYNQEVFKNLYNSDPFRYIAMEVFRIPYDTRFGGSTAHNLLSAHRYEVVGGEAIFQERVDTQVKGLLEELGFDGIIFNDTSVGTLGAHESAKTYVAFSPDQILLSPGEQTIAPQENIRAAVESGKWIDDIALSHFHEESWTKSEIARREDLRELASYLADTGLATSFDAFVAAAKEIEVTPQSIEYYQGIWDTTAKAEVELDETREVSVDARIDATIAAEEKQQTQRVPVTDRLLGDLEKTPMWRPDLEKVSDVLTAKEVPVTVVEGEELNAAQIANELGQNKKRLVQRMTHDFLKPPSAGIGHVAIQQIRALQEPYTTKETKSLNKARKALTTWQTAHPGQALISEAQAIMNRKGIKDLPVGELINLYRQSRDIRKQSTTETKAQREATKARRVQKYSDLLGEMPGGVAVERFRDYASTATQEKEKKLKRKGIVLSNIEHPLRLFKAMGPAWERILWDDVTKWQGEAVNRKKAKSLAIKELFNRTGTTTTEMLRKLPGTQYFVDDLMYYYGQFKDPDGRKAILYGNDENETTITRLFAELPQKYKDFMDGLLEINDDYSEVEKVKIEQTGEVGPKVSSYLPIHRGDDFALSYAGELSMDTTARIQAHRSGQESGFTKQRVHYREGTSQPRVRTDLLNIIMEQLEGESNYVAGEEWARDIDWLFSGRSKESKKLLEAVKQKDGVPRVTFLRDYVRAVVNPKSFNGVKFEGLLSRGFRNLNDAQLMYKLGSAGIQIEGPFRTLSQLNLKQWHYLAVGLWEATVHAKEAAEFVYQKEPAMQMIAEGQAIDPAISEGKVLQHSQTEIGLRLQKIHQGMRKGGYFLLQVMAKWTVMSEWISIYYANRVKLGEEAAIKAASDGVYLNQPSGELSKAPRMYWISKSNVFLAFLQRFSRASNQMAQMMTIDMWRELKAGHPGKMLGIIMSFAFGAFLMGLRRRKRFPKDARELLEDGIAGATDALGAGTMGAASAVVAGATGGFGVGEIKPFETFRRAGAIGKDIFYGNVSAKEVWRLINLVMQVTGLPSPAAENLVRTAYDFEEQGFHFDPIELFGRRPKE